jgi:quercetin dioxygenase-like cupin family protein
MPIHHNMLGNKPTTTERILFPIADQSLGTSSSLVYENVLNPGAEVPLHQHPVEEVIVCTEGIAECSIGGGTWEKYGVGSVLVIPAGTPHTLRNTGSGLLRQLAFMPSGTNQTKWLAEKGSVE